MLNSFIKSCLTFLLLSNFCSFALADPKLEQSTAAIALMQGNDRAQILLEGAKKEGELSVYLVNPVYGLVADAFAKKYGIKLKTWRAGSEAMLQRVSAESRAKRFEVDVVCMNGPEMEVLHRQEVLQQVKSPYLRDLIPQALRKHGEWVGASMDIFVQAYNPNVIKKEDLPKTYQDLLDPRWKGRLGIESADQHWFAAVLQELGHEKGLKLFKDIVATNGISLRKGHSLLGNLVGSGEVPLALTVYSWGPDQLKQKGAPIERFSISKPIASFSAVGVPRNAPHPYTAVLFYDFVLNEGQEIISKAHAVSVSKKLDAGMKQGAIKFIDPGEYLDNNEKWTQTFEELFVKRTK
jgi:iron(III) transport system substrate-binding protein